MESLTNEYQIFISYRREGGEDLARLLEYRLKERGFSVFLDVEALRSGEFNTALYDMIDKCTDVLVVLPPHALDRCINPNDWVRLEIARALEKRKNVIPVLMRNFEFPDTLPDDINALRFMNGVAASNEFFSAVIDKLADRMLKSLPQNGEVSDVQLEEAMNRGDVRAMNIMGVKYEFGSETILSNQPKAYQMYLQAAQSGDPGALYNLGDVYEQCSRDLALIYDFDIGGQIDGLEAREARIKMREKALEYYTLSAEKDFLPAVYRLGNLMEEGRDLSGAFRMYMSAADRGYAPAQNAVGYYLMNGIASRRDSSAALMYYKKAAEGGFAPGAYNYAEAMELTDINRAVSVYRRITFAIPEAFFALGRIYETVFHDMRNAVSYYHSALNAGITEAEGALKRCEDDLFGKNRN